MIVELRFAISTLEDKFFGLNAAKAALMQQDQVKLPSGSGKGTLK